MDINGIEFAIDDGIMFTSKHPDDVQDLWGTIYGFANYRVAKTFTDINAYHAEILELASDPPIDGYFLVRHQDDEIRAWHPTWIQDVQKIAGGQVTITLYYASEQEKDTALNMLKSSGYTFNIQ